MANKKRIDPHSQLHLTLHSNFGGNLTAVKQVKYFKAIIRNEKGTGAETRPAIVSGIVTGDAPVSIWPSFPGSFPCPW